ncbi:YqgE/AlgH family protein [Endozoicomonas sp. SCSIO W0465]|uniref:YqgE/AlgH family protein n=1 Tax=Endozoicomonas sp. SCSIO W0465 TaxID=2918516 RepID=UPI002075009E|nr:YqgE/AlgH family protein [Endozoicomonas sp. SCSIO W0465]USE36509.1 YqgE/AlgH family protein [Endozoicomonas sp. SCSIO W0465]
MSSVPFQNFKSHFLIAMPGMVDPSFAETLTIICEHSPEGALGIVVNRPSTLPMSEIFRQIGIDHHEQSAVSQHAVYSGGPVSQERGFVLNSGESSWDTSLEICPGLQLTTSTDVLMAMAEGKGPKQVLVALGYAGWGAGQLEKEISENAWLTCEAHPSVVFDTPYHLRLSAAASSLGVNLNLISDQVGHA